MASGDLFAFLSLAGERFDADGMPADSAIEVRNYREAVYAVARELWLRDNGDRSRVPKGFPTGFDLRLTSIDPGSAQPVLQLHRPTEVSADEFLEWTPYYERARDLLTQTIAAVSVDTDEFPVAFPKSAVRHVRRLGSSLDTDEVMIMGGPAVSSPRANLTQDIRAIISQIDARLGEESAEVSTFGVIIEADTLKHSFRLRRNEDGVVVGCKIGAYNEALARVMKDSLSVDGLNGPDVHVVGIADGGDEKLYRSLSEVSVLQVVRSINQKAAIGKLSEIGSLKQGWWGGVGPEFGANLIRSAESVLMNIRGPIEGLNLGPSKNGSLVFEWHKPPLDLTLELRASETMLMVSDNEETDELVESESPFNSVAAASFLVSGVAK